MTALQIVVVYNDHFTAYYPVDSRRGWRLDNPTRCLIIGRGVPRVQVPLDQVRSFAIEQYEAPDD